MLPPTTDRAASPSASRWLVLPAGVWYFFFFVIPLSFAFIFSFGHRGAYGGIELGFSFDQYVRLAQPIYSKTFLTTLAMASAGTLGCLILGYPLAYFLATRVHRHKLLMLLLVIIPFWTSFLIRTYGITILINDRGLLNTLLMNLGWVSEPVRLLFTPWGILLGLVYNYLPLMVFPLYVSLERLDKTLLEASKDLGAGRLATFRNITLPLSLPGVIAGLMLVFIPLTGEYVVPQILGGGKILFMGGLITSQFVSTRDWAFGSAAAVSLIVLLLLVITVYMRRLGRRAEDPFA